MISVACDCTAWSVSVVPLPYEQVRRSGGLSGAKIAVTAQGCGLWWFGSDKGCHHSSYAVASVNLPINSYPSSVAAVVNSTICQYIYIYQYIPFEIFEEGQEFKVPELSHASMPLTRFTLRDVAASVVILEQKASSSFHFAAVRVEHVEPLSRRLLLALCLAQKWLWLPEKMKKQQSVNFGSPQPCLWCDHLCHLYHGVSGESKLPTRWLENLGFAMLGVHCLTRMNPQWNGKAKNKGKTHREIGQKSSQIIRILRMRIWKCSLASSFKPLKHVFFSQHECLLDFTSWARSTASMTSIPASSKCNLAIEFRPLWPFGSIWSRRSRSPPKHRRIRRVSVRFTGATSLCLDLPASSNRLMVDGQRFLPSNLHFGSNIFEKDSWKTLANSSELAVKNTGQTSLNYQFAIRPQEHPQPTLA